jgi:Eco57I restriction-modification methylase
MEKKQLHNIFSKAFNNNDWLDVLQNVFGAKQLLAQPREILLPSNDKAKAAFELGNFTTSDDRIIGLYRIELNPDVWLERNKVGLRELLRNIYKYDVDGAIIVFDQGEKWRLSFVSEIKVLNDEGEVIEQATEPKRYTYLLGEDEKVRTPSERLNKLVGKPLTLNDILEAFSVEALNEEFYKIIAHYFYQLIGGTIGKGKKATDFGDGILQLPSVPKTNRLVYQEFAVRLIGRTIFSWFLKMKKSDAGKELLPDNLLSSKAVKNNSNYYHSVLERVFFQTLNTKMENRIEGLPKGYEQIPFLNGGLFEPDYDDYYRLNRTTGISENLNTLKISDDWFLNLFTELEKYNFTIDENSVTDVEVSVDPEMLGRIFENLLAEIDPDSGETARKATGSFYTPREIVDYMATESLVQYLHNKTDLKHEQLRPVFKMTEEELPQFSNTELESILDALDKIKILDPACGSGAFPMGILQKIVMALQKLDPDAKWWKERQIKRITNQFVRKALREKLEDSSVEYARKIGVIQNSLYGVDIQPIAAEISKLRCFLSLVVDETINENKPNRGIEPLPNLEFKFVTADTLMKLPEQKQQRTMFDNFEELRKLEELRTDYLQSSGKKKGKIKEQYIKVQTKMFKNEMHLFTDTESRAYKLSSWNPFSHEKADWFDPKWMYGVDNFDVIIGNPPYIKEATNKSAFNGIKGKEYYQGKMDIWYYFACHLLDMLPENGNLTFIATNNWVTNSGASKLRNKITEDAKIIQLVDFGNTKIFSSAGIQTMILIAERDSTSKEYKFGYKKIDSDTATLNDSFNMLKGIENTRYILTKPTFRREDFIDKSFLFNSSEKDVLLDKIKAKQNFELDAKKEVASGIDLLQDFVNKRHKEVIENVEIGDGIFNLSQKEYEALNLSEEERGLVKPFFTTNELQKYYGNKEAKYWVIYTNSSFKNEQQIKPYPSIKKHLDKFLDVFTSVNKPYGLHRSRDQFFFTGEKIFSLRKCSKGPRFTYTDFDAYVNRTFMVIKTNRIDQKFLTALFNSSLIEFWLSSRGKMQGFNFQVDKEPLLNIPIYVPESTAIFSILVDYIIQTKKLEKEQINPHVPNSHLVLLFEEVVPKLSDSA